jgi:hypothetical protein
MKALTFFSVAFFIFMYSNAQNTFQGVAGLPEKDFTKLLYVWPAGKGVPNGTGISPYLVDKEIKKIALVAFTITAGETYDKFTKVAKGFTSEGIKYFANKLYDNTVSSVKEAFNKEGIEVLTFDDLNADQKKNFLATQGTKWTEGKKFSSWGDKNFATGESAYQYKNWVLDRGVEVPWINSSIADFAEALGVDAVLMIANGLQFDGSKINYGNTLITMLGKNPVPVPEGQSSLGHLNGLWYGQAQIIFDKNIAFATVKKNEVTNENYDGLGQVFGKLIGYMMIDINGRKADPDFKFQKYLKEIK